MRKNLAFVCLLSLSVSCLSGCQSKVSLPEYAKRLVPVTGKVTQKGKPVEGATVVFLIPPNAASGERASGRTDANGQFELITPIVRASLDEQKGAVPGEYHVVISRVILKDGSPLPPDVPEAELPGPTVETIPAKYSNPETTVLKATVTTEPNVINFEL